MVVTPAVAGRWPSWRARIVARASTAPVAPMAWPWRLLVELTGICEARGPKTWWMAWVFDAVVDQRPVPWALDAVDLFGGDAGILEGHAHGGQSAFSEWLRWM